MCKSFKCLRSWYIQTGHLHNAVNERPSYFVLNHLSDTSLDSGLDELSKEMLHVPIVDVPLSLNENIFKC